MPLPRPYPDPASNDRVSLLAEMVRILVEELAAIGSRNWSDLPGLKKKKVVLASRLRAADWSPAPSPAEAGELRTLRTLVGELEARARAKVQRQMELIGAQIAALQDQHQYWRECLSVSFQRFYEAIPVG